ncbi:MAG: HD domain-containing protein [Anaerolineae bacterium]|nr:HD domain-containing protein [Anaerolineae bacterium]
MSKPTAHTPVERVTSRVYRFIRSARPGVSNLDRALAEEWLPDQQLVLFLSQSEADQRHAISVARLLLNSGYASRDLIAAALLHDVGKRGACFTPWHRTVIVLLEAVAPGLLRWLSRWEHYRLLAPFGLHLRHSRESAALAREAGASARTVRLIRCHHRRESEGDEEARILRWADDHA